MGDSRTKNASRNMFWGILNRVVVLVLPFITRTIILYLLGANYLGVGTLFSSILSFLSLTELGFGTAIVYAMYKPIARGDKSKIRTLLNYYKILYRKIGIVMLAIGTLLVPFIPYLIKGDTPENINIYILYYIYLLNSVVSYFFAGYRSSLLIAHQREDISTKVVTAVNIGVQAFQIVALLLTKNFYIYAFVPIIGTLITNALYYQLTKKIYPDIQPEGNIDFQTKKNIHKKISGLIGTKLNSIVIHSADTIVISTFLGLTMTAQYGNYYLIFNAVCGIIGVLFSAITAGIGNKLVMDSIEENYKLFCRLSYLNAAIVCWGSCCFLCLYEPFMTVWVKKDLCLGTAFVILMVLYFYIYQIQKTILTFKDAAGLWNMDKLRPYVSMIINLVSNIILVNFIGIYGIVISTIIAFFISLPWVNKVLFDNLFHMRPIRNLVGIGGYFVLTMIAAVATYFVCMICSDGLIGIIQRFMICCIIPNIIFVLATLRSDEFKYWKSFALNMIKK